MDLSTNAFKPSRFNAKATMDDGTLMLQNSASGAIVAIPNDYVDAVNLVLKRGTVTEGLDELTQELYEGGFLVPATTDEDDVLQSIIQQRIKNKQLQLIILPTEDCNFRCVYCYEHFKRGAMSQEIQDSIVRYFEEHIHNYEIAHIEWFGGDPLYAPDVVLSLGKRLYEIAQRHGVIWKSHMTTNGYNLTPDLSPELIAIGCRNFTITIDGICEEHDKRRVLHDGGPTFKRIIDNMLFLKSTDLDFNIRIRHNFDAESLKKAEEFLEFMSKHFADDPRFTNVNLRAITKFGGPNDDNFDICDKSLASRKRFEMMNRAADYGFFEKDLKFYMGPGVHVCYASDPHAFVIGSDGKIMRCTIELDTNDRNVVGQVEPNGVFRLDLDKMSEWVMSGSDDQICKSCFFAPSCQGTSCAKVRFDMGKRPCPDAKLYVKEALKVVYKEMLILSGQPIG